MKTEVLTIPKFRAGGRPGDDVPLVIPGLVHAVFDGATDPRGTVVGGIGAGRLAALTVARATAALAADPAAQDLPGEEILARLSAALRERCAPLGLPIPPSTTIAIVLDCGGDWRFLALGDTGLRLNGSEVFHEEKLIDAVSTRARVELFRILRPQAADSDAAEQAARRGILLGLDAAVAEGMIAAPRAAGIVAATVEATGLQAHAGLVEGFLRGGIQTQYRFGNDPGSPLGFDTLNGGTPRRGELLDFRRPKSAVRSIEIFTDGYPVLPPGTTAADWEAAHAAVIAGDPHMIGPHATVKGMTRDEFFDDRTVVILSGLLPG